MLAYLNFSRVVIILSFVGSAVLGWFVYQQHQQLKEVEDVLAIAPRSVQGLQERALQLEELERQVESDGLGGQADPEEYIRAAARNPSVRIGSVETDPLTDQEPAPGIVDRRYKIEPAQITGNTAQGFGLDQIANYLYLLEQNSRRVRVTQIEIKPAVKRTLKAHETLPGTWDFSAQITTRERRGS